MEDVVISFILLDAHCRLDCGSVILSKNLQAYNAVCQNWKKSSAEVSRQASLGNDHIQQVKISCLRVNTRESWLLLLVFDDPPPHGPFPRLSG